MFWIEDLPLVAGNNAWTIIATDAAGNVSSTNLSITQSAVTLAIRDDVVIADDCMKCHAKLRAGFASGRIVVVGWGLRACNGRGQKEQAYQHGAGFHLGKVANRLEVSRCVPELIAFTME